MRGKRGLSHVHVGSLHAPDAELALRNARDVYTRRQEGVSIWVVKADDITASSPSEKDSFFDPAGDKIYRHPTFSTTCPRMSSTCEHPTKFSASLRYFAGPRSSTPHSSPLPVPPRTPAPLPTPSRMPPTSSASPTTRWSTPSVSASG